MISQKRMNIDALGQFILLLSSIFLLFPSFHTLGIVAVIILSAWQIMSAVHLILVYKYFQKINFLKIFIVLIVSSFIWMKWVGDWAFIPVVVLCIWYFYQTIKDVIIIKRKPISFWNMKF